MEGIDPRAIINYDETNMTDDLGNNKVIVRKGSKHTHRILDTQKQVTRLCSPELRTDSPYLHI